MNELKIIQIRNNDRNAIISSLEIRFNLMRNL